METATDAADVSAKKNSKTVETIESVEFSVVKSGADSGYKKAQNSIIGSQREMDMTWEKLYGNLSRKPPIPMVDFSTKQLLLVTMGEQPSGGYSISVREVSQHSRGVVVTIEDAKPGKSCINTSVLTYPFQLIEMSRVAAEMSYVRIAKVNECD